MANKLTPAAAYIRMSGKQQDIRAEQRAEITKLATREDATSLSGSPMRRSPATAAPTPAPAWLLCSVPQRLASSSWSSRGTRTASAAKTRWTPSASTTACVKAGVGLHTCCEGAIDLEDFAKQLLLFINQKASNDFLVEMSAKTLRGRIANAKAGGHNGGLAVFAMDRGLFSDDGRLVHRLQSGEYVRQAGHRVRLLPCTDQAKIDAVQFAFNRFADADLGVRDLARELEAKDYQSPTGKGWTHHNVGRLLRTTAYVGTVQWGAKAWGKYHTAQGEDIVAGNGNGKSSRRKPKEDTIAVEGAHEGIIEPTLFTRVQAKLAERERTPSHRTRHFDYPLTGLIVCEHCGKPMCGNSLRTNNRAGEQVYRYQQYVCATYAGYGRDCRHNTTCGRNAIDANRVLAWIVHKLQEVFLGPARGDLIEEIKRQLSAEAKTTTSDVARLGKRAADLDRQVARLVKAIRTTDAGELVEELTLARTERDHVKAELAEAGRFADPMDLDTEAEQIADSLLTVGERLNDSDPAVLREVLRQFVSRVSCRWQPYRAGKYTRFRLIGGTVELRSQTPFSRDSLLLG